MPRLRDMTAYRLPLVLFLPAPLICCMIALQGLSNRIHLDTIHVLSQSDLRFYELTCWSPHEDHASGVISQMADALLILLTVQLVPQAILIAQRRWARTAKALSLALTSATLAFLLAILVKTSLLVKDLEATGPFPQLEQYCSTPRANSRARFEFRNDTDESEVRGVVILCAFDCAYKIVIVMFLFVLPTPMRIPIPFEPIVTGSKAHCLSEDSLIPPETGPVSKSWKNARQLSLSRGDACTALISTGNNTNQPSWVLSKRLTRMPVVASKSPCFSAQIQHWTQDRYRYRGLHAVIIFLSLAILFDILLLFAHLVTPIANERPCTRLCQLQIASLCWKPITLLISHVSVTKKIDLLKYRVMHVSLWHIVALLWCILPLSFPALMIEPFLNREGNDTKDWFRSWGVLHTVISGVSCFFLTLFLLPVTSTRLRHNDEKLGLSY